MMRKDKERKAARKLRKQGMSIKKIARELSVSSSSASAWCRDIELTPAQRAVLFDRLNGEGLRLMLARNKEILEKREIATRMQAIQLVANFDEQALLYLGLGLYLGDGSKGRRTCQLASANTSLLLLFMRWLEVCFGVERNRYYFRVIIHEKYRDEQDAIVREWCHLLKLPLSAFHGITFISSKTPPQYESRGNYKGTMHLAVRRSTELLGVILGMADLLVYKGGTHRPG